MIEEHKKSPVIIDRAFFMLRMSGMPRAHGCARAAMFRMNGQVGDVQDERLLLNNIYCN